MKVVPEHWVQKSAGPPLATHMAYRDDRMGVAEPPCIRRQEILEDFREDVFGKAKNPSQEGLMITHEPFVGKTFTQNGVHSCSEYFHCFVDTLQLGIELADDGAVMIDDRLDTSLFLWLCDIIHLQLV